MSRRTITDRLAGETRTPEEIREAVYLFGGDVGAKQSRFWLLLVLAACIATAGIVGDSTATVIGAMIVAPLAVPIQGVAFGIAYGELRGLLISLAIVLSAIAVVIAIGAGLSWVLPELHALGDNSQVTSRVSPTIVDLVAAATTGLAGAFAVTRRDIGDILPGVAIAISLVPPLAVVGVTAVAGDWGGALGALLLFATNMLAIIVVCSALFGAQRARAGVEVDASFRRRPVYTVVAAASVVVLAALAVLTYRTVQLANRQAAATTIGEAWASEYGERLLTVRFNGEEIVFVVEGRSDGEQDRLLPARLRGELPSGTPVVIDRVPTERHDAGDV